MFFHKIKSILSSAPIPVNFLQRKCVCGGSAGLDSECEECRRTRLSRNHHSFIQTESKTIPSIVYDAAALHEHSLDSAPYTFNKSCSGHDFSRLRVHSDAKLSEWAQHINLIKMNTLGQKEVYAGSRDVSLPGGVASNPEPATPPAPATSPAQPRRRACVSSERIPDNHSDITFFQGQVSDYFEMNIDWNNTEPGCDCRCGEYRQFVKGYIKINGRKQTKPLWGGANLEEDVYHEDGDGNSRYGHRSDSEIAIDRFNNPDRATGCSYRGRDTPGLQAAPGTHLNMLLDFKGQTYDVCNNAYGRIHSWTVRYNDFVP